MIRLASALGFGLLIAGWLILALFVIPDFGLALDEASHAAVAGTFASAVLVWLIAVPPGGVPSPGRGGAIGLCAALLANLGAAIAITLADPASGSSGIETDNIVIIATLGLVRTGPLSLPVAVVTGLFYALLLGLVIRGRCRPPSGHQ